MCLLAYFSRVALILPSSQQYYKNTVVNKSRHLRLDSISPSSMNPLCR